MYYEFVCDCVDKYDSISANETNLHYSFIHRLETLIQNYKALLDNKALLNNKVKADDLKAESLIATQKEEELCKQEEICKEEDKILKVPKLWTTLKQ